MHEITVLVDTRENIPAVFPDTLRVWQRTLTTPKPVLYRVHVEKVKLDAGDYALKGREHAVLIERKGSAQELYSNLIGPDRARAFRAFDKLARSTRCPILLLDLTLNSVYRWSRSTARTKAAQDVKAEQIQDFLLDLCAAWCIFPLGWTDGEAKTIEQRVRLGSFIARTLLAFDKSAGDPDDDRPRYEQPGRPHAGPCDAAVPSRQPSRGERQENPLR
jgi:ERCC4-type nuclease